MVFLREMCLKYGLAFILIFVGLKMVWLNNLFDGKFPINWSLAIIGALLFGSVVASCPTHGRAAPTPMGEEAR